MKLIAKIPASGIVDNIRYLVIESDPNDTKGFYLFFHHSLEAPCEADLWFADVEAAKRQAKYNYGIGLDEWLIAKP